jgi:hypothetical protein
MAVQKIPSIYIGGRIGDRTVGELDLVAQATTNAYVVLAGSEIDARDWDIVTIHTKNTGANSGTIVVAYSSTADFAVYGYASGEIAVAAGSQNVFQFSRRQYLATYSLLMPLRYMKIFVKSTVADTPGAFNAWITAWRG